MSYVGIGNRQDYIADFPTQSFNGDGSTTTFTLNFEAVTASIRVAVDNVLQPADGTSYYVDGNSLTFSSAPASGTNNISVVYLGTVRQISTVSDNSIANSKIQYPLTESGATVSTFNRTTSDGNIVELQKDGTTVGSIGVIGGDIPYFGTTDGSQCGINLDGDNQRLNPANGSGAAIDNQIDLGASPQRFKNLYLGGSVYLGGTGSANALDDYEEGTWTPTYEPTTGSFTSVTYDTQSGYYTKVGNLVTATFRIKTDAITVGTAAGALRIYGLPFNKSSVSNDRGVGAVWRSNWINTDAPEFVINGTASSSYLLPYIHIGATIRSTEVDDMGTGANDNEMYCSITYRTD